MSAALTTLAWLALAQLPPSTPAALTADEIEEDHAHHWAVGRGHAVLWVGTLAVHADEIRYDEETHRFEIPGPLFGVDQRTLLLAAKAEGRAGTEAGDEGELLLSHVRIEEYRWLPPDASKAATAAQVRGGRRVLIAVEGTRLRRLGPQHYELDGVQVSPCACEGDAPCRPDWALAARSADIHAGDYAILDWPSLDIAGVPIPLLRAPALYVPLAQRRTGFLLPHMLWQSQNGFLFDEPFFLTLGPSYDLTLSAGGITGASGAAALNGVSGPRASAEFRYAPSDDLTGRVLMSVIDDQHTDPAANGVQEMRGGRGSLRAIHVQNLDPRDGARLDLNLVSDARLTGQLTTDLLLAQIPATRSTASVFHRSDDWLLTLDGVLLQDFQGDFSLANPHGLLFGDGAPKTLQRLPALTLEVPARRLGATPIWASLEASAVREGVLGAAYDSLALGSDVPGTLVPTVAIDSARAAVEQLDLRPELSLPLQWSHFATGLLSAAWRQDVWLFESNPLPADLTGSNAPGAELPRTGERGYPILDARLRTELSRSFGAGDDRVLHTLAPEVEIRSLPFQLNGGTVPPLWLTPTGGQIFDRSTGQLVAQSLPLPYDEIALAPGLTAPVLANPAAGSLVRSSASGALTQGQLHLDQRLRTKAGELARLDVGEFFDGAGPESTFVRASLQRGPLQVAGFADLSNAELPCPGCTADDRTLRRLTEAWLALGLSDPRGDTLGLNLARAIAAGAPRLSAPLDLLFAPRLPDGDPRWRLADVSQIQLTGQARLPYGLKAQASATYQLSAGAFSQIQVGGGYDSPRHCCNVGVSAVVQPSLPGQLALAAVLVSLDLGEFGGSTQTQ